MDEQVGVAGGAQTVPPELGVAPAPLRRATPLQQLQQHGQQHLHKAQHARRHAVGRHQRFLRRRARTHTHVHTLMFTVLRFLLIETESRLSV